MEAPLRVTIEAGDSEVGGVIQNEALGDSAHVRLVSRALRVEIAREHLAVIGNGGEEVGTPRTGLPGCVEGFEIAGGEAR